MPTVTVPPRRGVMLYATDLSGSPKGDNTVGYPLPIRTWQKPQVTVPLSDSRTGAFTISMYEPIAEKLTAGDTAIKAFYTNPKGTSVFLINGIVLLPTSDYDAGTISLTLIDPTERLKHRFVTYDSISVELSLATTVSDANVNAYTGGSFNGENSVYGIPLDGRGLRVLLYDAAAGTTERGGTVPFGLRTGLDSATPQPPYGTGGVPPGGVYDFTATSTIGSTSLTGVSFTGATWNGAGSPTIADVLQYMRLDGPGIPAFTVVSSASGSTIVMSLPATASGTVTNGFTAEDAIYCQITRGDNSYQDFLSMANAQGGLECDWIPVDATHLGYSGAAWVAGQMAELYTADRVGTDRSQSNTGGIPPVVFVHGQHGVHITHAPDADQTITYSVNVGPGGPADPLDQYNKAEVIATVPAGVYGYYQSWNMATNAGTGDTPISNRVLKNRCLAELTGYQVPPDFVTITCDSDALLPFTYGDDFFLGDTVTVAAHKGYKSFQADCRVTSIGVSQVDENGNCQLVLTAVPYLIAVPATTGGN